MRPSLFWMALILCGCSTAWGTAVQLENWPNLRVVEHRVSPAEVREACQRYAPAWGMAEACAIFYARECHVWATDDGDAGIERDNCRGLVKPYWIARATEIRDEINRLQAKPDR